MLRNFVHNQHYQHTKSSFPPSFYTTKKTGIPRFSKVALSNYGGKPVIYASTYGTIDDMG